VWGCATSLTGPASVPSTLTIEGWQHPWRWALSPRERHSISGDLRRRCGGEASASGHCTGWTGSTSFSPGLFAARAERSGSVKRVASAVGEGPMTIAWCTSTWRRCGSGEVMAWPVRRAFRSSSGSSAR
jgi:hypothetical protein